MLTGVIVLVIALYGAYFAGLILAVMYSSGPDSFKPALRKRFKLISAALWFSWFPPAGFILASYLFPSYETRIALSLLGFTGLLLYVLIVVLVPTFIRKKPPFPPTE
ncbi:MAG: hypothetical protein KBC81_03805 [Candidatus Pacebacteria bacterium]|nr:hypothetical protein [Candidatus Paceibacterota bacterium]